MQNKRLTIITLTVAMILLVPLIAMQFTVEVNWTVSDFVVAGVLLLTTALLCGLVWRKIKNVNYRIAICIILLFSHLLIWAELTVGIFETTISGN